MEEFFNNLSMEFTEDERAKINTIPHDVFFRKPTPSESVETFNALEQLAKGGDFE